MPDDKSFKERVEDIREERSQDDNADEESEDRSRDDNADQDAQNNNHQRSGAEEGLTSSQKKALAALIGGYVLAALAVASQPTEDPALMFLVGGAFYGALGWVIFTKEGRKWVMQAVESAQDVGDQQQQQQSSDSKKRNVICQKCGWRNPKSNNYCHDCGDKLAG